MPELIGETVKSVNLVEGEKYEITFESGKTLVIELREVYGWWQLEHRVTQCA